MSDHVNEFNKLKLQEAEDNSIVFLEKYPNFFNTTKSLAKMAADRLAQFEKEKSKECGWLAAHYLSMLENQMRRLQKLSRSEEFEQYVTCKAWQDTIVQLECSLEQMKSCSDLQPWLMKYRNLLIEVEMDKKKDSSEEDTDEETDDKSE